MSRPIAITAFYKFTPIAQADLPQVQKSLQQCGKDLRIRGLFLIATEGINATVAGHSSDIAAFKKEMEQRFGPVTFKDSTAEKNPFRRWLVKEREEIVALGDTEIVPKGTEENYISPQEWNRMMEEEDVVVIDTRNDYETAIGMFEGAVDPRLKIFSDFPAWVQKAGIPKDKKVLMYCTGGIRCEKASLEMRRQGYANVYQLHGGILRYLQECPRQKFRGECFVFDHRAAVDQDLRPSAQYSLCPHCGNPGDQDITCPLCKRSARICQACKEDATRQTCSKNCAYHAALKSAVSAHSEA